MARKMRSMTALEKLREGYARDLIDLETFERFVGAIVEGKMVALPMEVAQIGPVGPPNAANMHQLLKAAWTESQFDKHDWGDGKGRVHSISLEEHEANLRTLRFPT